MIRKLSIQDIDQTAVLHHKELPGFLSQLGLGFLKKYYIASLNIPELFTLAVKKDGQIMGFATGSMTVGGLTKKIIFSDPVSFGVELLKYLIVSPSNIFKVLKLTAYPGFSENNPELLSMAVSKIWQNKGIGSKLFSGICEEYKKRGVNNFKVSVYERLAAVKFYEKKGCILHSTFDFLGEKMRYYTYRIKKSKSEIRNSKLLV